MINFRKRFFSTFYSFLFVSFYGSFAVNAMHAPANEKEEETPSTLLVSPQAPQKIVGLSLNQKKDIESHPSSDQEIYTRLKRLKKYIKATSSADCSRLWDRLVDLRSHTLGDSGEHPCVLTRQMTADILFYSEDRGPEPLLLLVGEGARKRVVRVFANINASSSEEAVQYTLVSTRQKNSNIFYTLDEYAAYSIVAFLMMMVFFTIFL